MILIHSFILKPFIPEVLEVIAFSRGGQGNASGRHYLMGAENWSGVEGATILFADDNEALLRSVERLLRMEGFRVILASDGEDALNKLADSDVVPDLIISDVTMPRMDGFQLFREVRRHEQWLDIRFLFLTARDQIEDLRAGYSLGADDYLVKPLEQERLLLVIQSKLKRRAELLERIQIREHALDTAKRELSLMVAHELRTPLVSISMVTDILSREMDQMGQVQTQELVETMRSGSIRLSRLIEQMVLYVQLRSGALNDAITTHARPGYVRDAVIGAVDRARQFSYRQREIPLRFEESDPDVLISGDLGSLKHALAELLSNAMAFSTPEDLITVSQWVSNDRVWIAVTDRGPGIPEHELGEVFKPYHQVNRQKYEQQGVGIGLPLARGIIMAHGGTLELRSIIGKGTQAIVSLPVYVETQNWETYEDYNSFSGR